ncbi:TonB family C-terminal domain-containing protein [Hymenobacter daecheongensis DSM 21074]|uniref:TonB family C-terminal domain-containing protein n=1 Tax=Hymenobacter daecheongensis DSM 21074 TaxID=1121955 RepID=A0A1M6IVR3_9BACT|nr:M56 family metallopeptidase [Hymenobacter daecheongensis]SHJ38551.1 TonB family C-terminal domain-containing protein [Hymenobacter daecheongensis DSM 21074]
MQPLTLPALLNWWWQSTLLLGAGWLFYQLALRPEPGFRYNRRFLCLAPLLALVGPPLLPLATPLLQSWLPTAAPTAPLRMASFLLPAVSAGGAPTSAFDWRLAALALYGAGVALGLAGLGTRLGRLWRLTRRLPREARPGYVLVRTGGRLPTSSFGRWVFWDETAPLAPAEAALVLAHEVAHVRQRHSLDRLLLEVLRSVLWPNPFVHLYPRALELTHEYLADAAVLGPKPAPEAATHYGALLARLTLQRLQLASPLAHSFTYSQTLNRIAMLKPSQSVRRWKQWLPLPATALLLLTLAAANATAQTAPPPPPLPPPSLMPPPPPPPKLEKVYTMVDQMPEYPGGQDQLLKDVGANTKYPAAAKAANLGGKVFIQFVIGSDGIMRDITLMKGITPPAGQEAAARELDAAALQAIGALQPRWTPGRHKGRPVAVSYTIPLTFAPEPAPAR